MTAIISAPIVGKVLSGYALAATVCLAAVHVILTASSPSAGYTDPVAMLSQSALGWMHSAALVIFASAHIALATSLGRSGNGYLFQMGRCVLFIAAGLVLWMCVDFLSSEGAARTPATNIAQVSLASSLGTTMGLFAASAWRQRRHFAMLNLISLICFLLFAGIAPVVEAQSLGTYERCVAIVYVGWLMGIAIVSWHDNQRALQKPHEQA